MENKNLKIEKTAENPKVISYCLSCCEEKYVILNQIRSIENRIKMLADQYNTIGDTKNAEHYLSYIK